MLQVQSNYRHYRYYKEHNQGIKNSSNKKEGAMDVKEGELSKESSHEKEEVVEKKEKKSQGGQVHIS